ncbi:hypothetical protein GGI15_000639 [Coemansia interrupta]|uniref:Uncharacterized protein n=1 Tax=Coemansia interrupta TaxID=1126814 RepID=A0A9W8HQS3_9FUNG|nr:hypothetical protein GGI15_000639 [Coemansia interrupta]
MSPAATSELLRPKTAPSPNLYDFPAPPDQPPNVIRNSMLIPDPQKRASRRLSANGTSPPCSPCPAPQDLGNNKTQEVSAPGLYLGNFKRFSKSTTSLPAMLSSHNFGLCDDIQLGDYQYYPSEADQKTAAEHRQGKAQVQQPSADQPHQLRAARSHHNLQNPEDCGVLSQSMLSMASKIEPMPDVADLLSPIECDSYEYVAEEDKPTGIITLVSHHTNEEPLSPPASAFPMQSAPETSVASNGVRTRVAGPIPRKQMSMAQLEARCINRNSMLVSGTLLPAVHMAAADDLAQQSRNTRDPLDIQLDKRLRRASRYLYDVPGSGPLGSGGGVQETLSKALNWPQRLGRTASKRDTRTNSTVIDQYKIYDIYEESIWHSTHAAGSGVPGDSGFAAAHVGRPTTSRARASRVDGSLGTAPEDRERPGGVGMRTLRSVASSPGLLPWRMMKTWKPQTLKTRNASYNHNGTWGRGGMISGSDYSDSESDSDSDLSIGMAGAAAGSAVRKPPKAAQRKPSTIHLFVKKASLSLIRRSVSFYKSVGGSNNATKPTAAGEGFDGTVDLTARISSSSSLADRTKPKKRTRRLASALRHAGSMLRGTLRASDRKRPASTDSSSDIVSAYPTDSMPGRDLESYLSSSACNSPSMEAPTTANNSTTVCGEAGRESESESDGDGDSVGSTSVGSYSKAAKYVPPRRPPFLGLHRKRAGGGEPKRVETGLDHQHQHQHQHRGFGSESYASSIGSGDGSGGSSSGTFAAAPSSASARLRPTQFNSPFTTLPYGAYAQLNQMGQRQYHPPTAGE